jgi:hypothetical protein
VTRLAAARWRTFAAVPAASSLRRLLAPAGLVLAAAAVQGAHAQPQIRLSPPAPAPARRLDLGRLASPYDAGQALKAQGIATTAVGHSFQDSGAKASVGFLCGLAPTTATSGGAGAMGVDHDGRFLGAQLRFGFQ